MLDVCNRKSLNQNKELRIRKKKLKMYNKKLNNLVNIRNNRKKRINKLILKLDKNENDSNLQFHINKLSRNYTSIDMECHFLKKKVNKLMNQ